jgi:hypothetical protein
MSNTYLYQNKPFIQHGTGSLVNGGPDVFTTITFSEAFSSVPTVVCTPANAGSPHDMLTLKIGTITTSNFTVIGWLKDGRGGESGGFQYWGDFYWIAVI